MYHIAKNGSYAKVLGSVNPFGEEPKGTKNDLYEIENQPDFSDRQIIDWDETTTDESGIRITSLVLKDDPIRKAQTGIQEYQQYLADTDWYVIRKAETGKAVPGDVTEKRRAARVEIDTLQVSALEEGEMR